MYFHVEGAKYEGEWIEDQQVKNNFDVILSTDMALKYGQIEPNTQDSIFRVKKKGRVNLFGAMEPPMRVISRITISKVKENIFGQMEGNTKGNGRTIRCMELGCSPGLMANNTKVKNNYWKFIRRLLG